MWTCVFVYVYVYVYVYVHVYMYIYVCVCLCIYICKFECMSFYATFIRLLKSPSFELYVTLCKDPVIPALENNHQHLDISRL